MNAKPTRRVLNVAFKEFQRLPDWPLVKVIGKTPLFPQHGQRTPLRETKLADQSGAQSFVE